MNKKKLKKKEKQGKKTGKEEKQEPVPSLNITYQTYDTLISNTCTFESTNIVGLKKNLKKKNEIINRILLLHKPREVSTLLVHLGKKKTRLSPFETPLLESKKKYHRGWGNHGNGSVNT